MTADRPSARFLLFFVFYMYVFYGGRHDGCNIRLYLKSFPVSWSYVSGTTHRFLVVFRWRLLVRWVHGLCRPGRREEQSSVPAVSVAALA